MSRRAVPTPDFPRSRRPTDHRAHDRALAGDMPRFRTVLNGKLIPLPEPVRTAGRPGYRGAMPSCRLSSLPEPQTLSTDGPALTLAAADPQLPAAPSGTEVAATDAALVLDTVQIVQDSSDTLSAGACSSSLRRIPINLVNLL